MKKVLSLVMAAAIVASMSVTAFAADPIVATDSVRGSISYSPATQLFDGDMKLITGTNAVAFGGTDTLENVRPDSTIYIPLRATGIMLENSSNSGTMTVNGNLLADEDFFKFKIEKDGDGKSIIKKVSIVNDKKADGGSNRYGWIKVEMNPNFLSSEKKAELKVTFTSKGTKVPTTGLTAGSWVAGEYTTIDLTMWINNAIISGEDADASAGDQFVFAPTSNEKNTVTWEDVASLTFVANDDAQKFFAKVSTKADSTIYSEYGDPVNAELKFIDFVGAPTISATSRATLTLFNPWTEEEDYQPDPADCFVYEKIDGELVDVTDRFVYGTDENDVEGWTIKTRTLGSYIISDTELDLAVADVEEDITDDATTSTPDGDKGIPNTGSSDMVNVAVVAGIVSLAAAGAVAFKKASK